MLHKVSINLFLGDPIIAWTLRCQLCLNYLFFLAVKNVQTKVALMQEVVLRVLVFAVHVREFKNNFLVFVPTKLLNMCFDRFLLAFESRDLSQVDKSIIGVSSFPSLVISCRT